MGGWSVNICRRRYGYKCQSRGLGDLANVVFEWPPKEVLNGAIYEQEFMHKFSDLITMVKMVLTMLNTRVSM